MSQENTSLFHQIKSWLWKSEGQQELITPQNLEIQFKLIFNTLEIGTLILSKGKWTFVYSEAFKAQKEIKPLLDFPNLDKEYSSEDLYPFFVQRIPGLNQPKVKEILEKEHIDAHNEALLLKRFGRYTISNPFELKAV